MKRLHCIRATILLLASLVFPLGGIRGQVPGERIRVSGVLVDEVVRVDSVGFHLKDSGLIPHWQISKLEVGAGKKSYWKRGLGVGLAVGLGVGVIAGAAREARCEDPFSSECIWRTALTGAIPFVAGGVVGWIVGASIHRDVWRVIPIAGAGRVGFTIEGLGIGP